MYMNFHGYCTNDVFCILFFLCKVEFSVYLSPSELADREKCVELLTERVEDYVIADQRTNQGGRSGNTSSSTTSYSLYR